MLNSNFAPFWPPARTPHEQLNVSHRYPCNHEWVPVHKSVFWERAVSSSLQTALVQWYRCGTVHLSTLSTQTCEAHVSQKFWKLVLSYSKEEQHCQALMPLKHCEVRLCSQSTRPRGDCTGKAKCVRHCLESLCHCLYT